MTDTNSKLKCIYLDMDGVLVDFVGGAFKVFEIDPELRTEVKSWSDMTRVVSEQTNKDIEPEEFWQRIADEGEDFWANLEWLPWGEELLHLCMESAPTVLMTAPTSHHRSASGKLLWINSKMPKDWQKRYAMSPCKHHMAHPGALLIDDGEHNIVAFREHNGSACLIPNTWNSYGYFPTKEEVLEKVQLAIREIK